jgi:ParB family chromosome partitioning protein
MIPLKQSDKSNEWYTPVEYIHAAKAVMGNIDLDPASCELANRTVKATHYYTKEINGLTQSWEGRVWLNPPFTGTNSREIWVKKLLSEFKANHIDQAILLMPVATDTKWFQPLWEYPICFPGFRINFYQENPKSSKGSPNFVTCFVYFGPHEQKFAEVFSKFGIVAKAVRFSKSQNVENLSLWGDS